MSDVVNIVLIMDDGYILPTATAVYSMVKNKDESTKYKINIVYVDGSYQVEKLFKHIAGKNVEIAIGRFSGDKYASLHKYDENAICAATSSALVKFELPYLFKSLDKILYMDGDIIVNRDLTELYALELEDNYVAAAVDSGCIYYKHKYTKLVKNYFNSGVMLLNLKKMRDNNITQVLIEEKVKSNDSNLMDQNVFNIVFDGKVKCLSLVYNYLYVNLLRAKDKFSIEEINSLYGTNYSSLEAVLEACTVIHYSSKDKPWKFFGVPAGDIWLRYYYDIADLFGLIDKYEILVQKKLAPDISVIIPIYNTCKYLEETLRTIQNQTYRNIEIICVDDGSTDNSLAILQEVAQNDDRFVVIKQKNQGQGAARNVGIKFIRGKYVYFMDSDDHLEPGALEKLYKQAEENSLDLLMFAGTSFFENEQLEKEFSRYKDAYVINEKYDSVYSGEEIFALLREQGDYKVSPCLKFIRRDLAQEIKYIEGFIYEDNVYALELTLRAKRVQVINDILFERRVRDNSTITQGVSFRSFAGQFIAYIEMLELSKNMAKSKAAQAAAQKMVNIFYRHVINDYLELSPDNRKIPIFLGSKPYQREDYATTVERLQRDFFNKGSSDKEVKQKGIMSKIKGKLSKTVQCYHDFGLKYTLYKIGRILIKR